MSQPTISIIIPTYNRASYVLQSVASVLAQSFKDYELIVVDDGSEDETWTQLARLNDSRLQVLRIAHSGASVARNAGVSLARGELIAFLDSDDLWAQDFLTHTFEALQSAPAAGFAYTDYGIFDTTDTVVTTASLRPEEKINGRLFPRILGEDFICMGSLLFRRGCLERAGDFDPQMAPAEDWDMWLRITPFFDASYVDAPLLSIRFHSDNISQRPGVIQQANLRIMEKFRQQQPMLADRYQDVIRRNCLSYHKALARHTLRARQPTLTLKHLAQVLILSVSWFTR
jgi:cellulose synthase/poly-beta-1,6-N-acetylglucosamine synthase-like glycosyltransferase